MSNQTKITRFLRANDWDNTHVAAAEGNMFVESGFRPDALNTGEQAIGICQWEGGRRNNLQKFAKSRGLKETDLDAQLGFILHELDGSESNARDSFFSAKTVTDAATAWDEYYERSSGAARSQRVAKAVAIGKTLKPAKKITTVKVPAKIPGKPVKAPVAVSGRTYTVQLGDSLSSIASRYRLTWQTVYAANRTLIGGDPDAIFPGQVLHIPNTRGEVNTVTVKTGDTLTSIAKAHGVANWQALYDRNRTVIGADPGTIIPGEVLALP